MAVLTLFMGCLRSVDAEPFAFPFKAIALVNRVANCSFRNDGQWSEREHRPCMGRKCSDCGTVLTTPRRDAWPRRSRPSEAPGSRNRRDDG